MTEQQLVFTKHELEMMIKDYELRLKVAQEAHDTFSRYKPEDIFFLHGIIQSAKCALEKGNYTEDKECPS